MGSKVATCREKTAKIKIKTKGIYPRIFILSGPGGAGKTTLLNRLFHKKFVQDNFLRTVSVTTRAMRKGENEAKDYFFLKQEEFLWLEKKGFFLETQKVLSDFYGTPAPFLKEAKRMNKDLILCVDVKGAEHLKNKFKKNRIISVFITAPNEKELYSRLKKRKEAKPQIEERVKLAKKELQFSKYYDYLIVNKRIKESLGRLEEILKKERGDK